MKNCPACSKPVEDSAADCPYCHIFFAKWQQRQAAGATIPPPDVKAPRALLDVPRSKPFQPAFIYVPALIALGVFLYAKRGKIEQGRTIAGIAAVGMLSEHDFANFVKQQDLESVRRYLKAGASPNLLISREPVLVYTLAEGNVDMAMEFLNAGADPNVQDRNYGRTPLMLALSIKYEDKRKEMIQALLAKGARLDLADKKGMTALQYAEQMGLSGLLVAPTAPTATYSGVTDDYIADLLPKLKIDTQSANAAMAEIRKLGPPAAMALVRLSDKPEHSALSSAALRQLNAIPAEAAPILEAKFKKNPNSREYAELWAKTAPNNQEKTRILIKILETPNLIFDVQHRVFELLAAIGPEAKEALPTLRKFEGDYTMRQHARPVIERIEGTR